MPTTAEGVVALGLSVGLGLLVGLQREWAEKPTAGVRTFPLIAALGALCGLLARVVGDAWILPAGLLATTALFWMGRRSRERREGDGAGLTTAVTGLVIFAVGASVALGRREFGLVTAGVTAALLHGKRALHRLAARLGEADLTQLVRLSLIALVILPVLPDADHGPFGVWNPFEIWLLVVLIVGMSMAAYLVRRLVGPRVGTLLSGVLGGLISSTAAAVSCARRSHAGEVRSRAGAAIVMLASTTVFVRVLVEVAAAAPGHVVAVTPPLIAMMAWMTVLSALSLVGVGTQSAAPPKEPPDDLKAAIVFGLLYGVVLLVVALAKQHLGDEALYWIAGISGLADVDAITLSSARMMETGALETGTGWRLILVGSMSNLVFKFAAVAFLGTPALLRRLGLPVAASLAGSGLLLWLWPG